MRAVVTVLGSDKVGIIARVATILAEYNVNILDITQTIMQNIFTMIMLVDLSGADKKVAEIAEALDKCGDELGVSISIKHEELFNSMHRI